MLRPKGRLNRWECKFEAVIWEGGQGLQIEKAHFKSQGKYEKIVAKRRMQTSSGIKLPMYSGEWVEGGFEVCVWFPSHCHVDLLLNKQNVQSRLQECVLAISCSRFWYATNAGRKPDKTVQRANWMGWGLVSRLRGWVWRVCAFPRSREGDDQED